jgi:hypothetical protein
MRGSIAKTPDPLLIDAQLRGIRERLASKPYKKLQGHLERKGWVMGTRAGRSQLKGAFIA